MVAALGARPYGRERAHMRQIERMNNWLPNVRIRLAGNAPKPRLDRIHCLPDRSKSARVNCSLNCSDLLVSYVMILVIDANGRRKISETNEVVSKFLKCRVCV